MDKSIFQPVDVSVLKIIQPGLFENHRKETTTVNLGLEERLASMEARFRRADETMSSFENAMKMGHHNRKKTGAIHKILSYPLRTCVLQLLCLSDWRKQLPAWLD